MISWWRSLGPATLRPAPQEMIRSSVGAALGLFLADLILWALTGTGPMMTQTLLIGPFGATAFLIFAVPTSPLAQPWPVVVGNTLSALAALGVLQLGLPMVPALSLAVFAAMLAMGAARALHPPGGAVAVATILAGPNLWFALQPILTGSVALVALGMLWNLATGRQYPHRPPAPNR